MKTMSKALLCAATLLTMTACGGSSPEKTYEKIKGFDGKMLMRFGGPYEDYHDINGTCLNDKGIKKTCSRIMEEPASMDLFFLDGKNQLHFETNEDGTKVAAYDFHNNDVAYYRYVDEEQLETITLYGDDSDKWCVLTLKGTTKGDALPECGDNRKEEIEKLKTDRDDMLKKMDVSMEDLVKFTPWFYENEAQGLIAGIKEEKGKQKALSASEVKKVLSENVKFSKSGGTLYLEDVLYELYYVGQDTKGLVFKSTVLTDRELYVYANKNMFFSNDSGTCQYSLNQETIMENKKCSEDDISNAKSMQREFGEYLNKYHITFDEFFHFLESYV